jgi:ribose 5-phosphate isomerase B
MDMIYLGSDHGGFELKQIIKKYLSEKNIKFEDLGNLKLDSKDDYPEYAFKVAEMVGRTDNPDLNWSQRPKGILVCRSAAGMIIAANKVKNVMAVAVSDEKSAQHSRSHNDANVIALSGDWLTEEKALKIVEIWLSTEFSKEERHVRRLKQIQDYEKS